MFLLHDLCCMLFMYITCAKDHGIFYQYPQINKVKKSDHMATISNLLLAIHIIDCNQYQLAFAWPVKNNQQFIVNIKL